jgi:hypothetical protein
MMSIKETATTFTKRLVNLRDRSTANKKIAVLVAAILVVGGMIISFSFAATQPTTNITIDGNRMGAYYYGIGAISGGGGNSRFLIDYPQAQQTQILDYLFEPNFGANLQLLKLEIGGDTNTSAGSEPSVEPVQGQINCNVGYEWSLAQQAEALNPSIKLYALQWGAPGWVGSSVWTTKDVSYVIDWLNCAKSHGLTISYLGGWNESGYNVTWYENMRNALNTNGYKNVQLVADDEYATSDWSVAPAITNSSAFSNAVAVVGAHDKCGWPTTGYTCTSTSTAKSLAQPLWDSELGKLDANTYGDSGGSAILVRSINNSYIQAGVTGLLEWPLIDSDPSSLPYQNRGLVTADEPWSGQYSVNQLTWATAQTTQFVPQGWHHVNGANQPLGTTGTYNTYESPNKTGWTMVAENTGTSATQTVVAQNIKVKVEGGLPTTPVHVWETNLASSNPSDWFVQDTDVQPTNGVFSYTIPAGYVVTFSTEYGHKGAVASIPSSAPTSLPYVASKDASDEPNYFAAQEGAFEYVTCQSGRTGSCIQQMAPQVPVLWSGDSVGSTPYGVVGDPSWQNYTVSSDVYIPGAGMSAGVIGRFSNQSLTHKAYFDGYDFMLSGGTGTWSLNKDSSTNGSTVLESGGLAGLTVGKWHTLSLSMQGSTLTASIDGKVVATVTDSSYSSGLAGLESTWDTVQYDNFQVQ